MSSIGFTNEHGYCASNRLEKWWPLSSSRESDQPKSERKHRRRVWKVPKDQPLIDSFFKRSPDCNQKQDHVKKSLFRGNSPSQTLIDEFLIRCSISDPKKDKAKRMLFNDDCQPSTSSKTDDTAEVGNKISDGTGIETVESPQYSGNDEFCPAGLEDIWSHGNFGLMSVPAMNCASVIFHGYVEESEEFWGRAIKHIDMTKAKKPPVAALQTLLHTILMKSSDEEVRTKAFNSLNSFLQLHPPCNLTYDYYHEVLFVKRKWDDWEVFKELIKCCKKKCGIIPKSCGMNCILVLKYFVAVFEKEYKEFMKLRPFSPLKYRECPKLTKKLMWKSNSPQSTSLALESFIHDIDRIFSEEIGEVQLQFFSCLMKLIGLAAECARLYEDYTEELAAVKLTFVEHICQHICSATNITKSTDNLELFLSSIELTWLRMAICESIINREIGHGWHAGLCGEALTLKKIVCNYMLMIDKNNCSKNEENEVKQKKVVFTSEENEVKQKKVVLSRKRKPKITVKRGNRGKTPLHQWCAEGRAGTLAENLKNSNFLEMINATDNRGWTPLHEACFSGSVLCVSLCLESESRGGPSLNVCATDDTLLTPLHIAVLKDNCEIVKLLLDAGGVDQLNMKNEDGVTPSDLVWSEAMRILVHQCLHREADNNFLDDAQKDGLEHQIAAGKLPEIFDSASFRIYLICLQMLIKDFFSFYDLLTLYQKALDTDIEQHSLVRQHLEGHLSADYSVSKTIEDLSVLKFFFKSAIERFLYLSVARFDGSDSKNQEIKELLMCFKSLVFW